MPRHKVDLSAERLTNLSEISDKMTRCAYRPGPNYGDRGRLGQMIEIEGDLPCCGSAFCGHTLCFHGSSLSFDTPATAHPGRDDEFVATAFRDPDRRPSGA